jgi:hypothetical protein
MTVKLAFALTLCLGIVFSQETKPPAPPALGSISGVVTVTGTGAPIEGVELYVGRATPKPVRAVTDSAGRYELRGVEPGRVQVQALAPAANGRIGFGPRAERQVNLLPGQELTSFDFRIVLHGEISGRVVDQNKEPVPDITVLLVSREYVSGRLRAVFTSAGNTDDQGEYNLERVQPGRPYLLMARRRPARLDPISDAPADPALRRRAVMPTFYPNAGSMDGAEALVLRGGERRERVDIQLVRTPSYCLEGLMEGGSGPTDLRFDISETQPAAGVSGDGGFYTSGRIGQGAPDGKIRICDLHPGEYELAATQFARDQSGSAPFFGSTIVTITDKDLQNVRVSARPRIPVTGEVVWDGPAPEPPLDAKLRLRVRSFVRTQYGDAQPAIPGEFEFKGGLLLDDYVFDVIGVPKGVYIKGIVYGDDNLLHGPLRVGRAMGNSGIRIVLARNGAVANVRVTDKDGHPVPDCSIVLMPAAATSNAALAATLTTGRTDQNGTWSSVTLAPGKYHALATLEAIYKTPELIDKLVAARSRAQEVSLDPNGAATVTLSPRSLE